jgi:hypothetical protein
MEISSVYTTVHNMEFSQNSHPLQQKKTCPVPPYDNLCPLFNPPFNLLTSKYCFLFFQVDIGQVEGAFVMGLGLWTSEEVKHDPTTGDLLTKNTWVNTKNGCC